MEMSGQWWVNCSSCPMVFSGVNDHDKPFEGSIGGITLGDFRLRWFLHTGICKVYCASGGANAIAEFDKLPYDITLERLEKIMLLQ